MSRACFVSFVTFAWVAGGCAQPISPPATVDLATDDFASGIGGNGATGDMAAPAEPRDLAGIGAADLARGDFSTGASDLAVSAPDLAAPIDLAVASDLAEPPVANDLAVAPAAGDLASPPVTPDLATPVDFATGADMARCPYAPTGSALYLLAPSGSGLFAARAQAGAWSALPAAAGDVAVDDVALASVAGRPLAVVRRHDATLAAVTFDDCSGFVAPAPIGTLSSALRPALVGGATADVVFRGSINGDARLYWLHDDGSGLGGGTVATQDDFLSTLQPTAFRAGGDVHTIFTGTDGNLYDGTAQASGGGSANALTGNTSRRAPAVAVDAGGAVHVLYSGDDDHLYSFVAGQPTVVTSLCDGQPAGCFVVTDAAPLIAIGSDDTPVALYHGSDGALYSAQLVGGWWTAVVAVSAGETTSLPAAIVTGSNGSIADVVYVRDADGLPRHASLGAGGWSAPITIVDTPLTAAPALAVAP